MINRRLIVFINWQCLVLNLYYCCKLHRKLLCQIVWMNHKWIEMIQWPTHAKLLNTTGFIGLRIDFLNKFKFQYLLNSKLLVMPISHRVWSSQADLFQFQCLPLNGFTFAIWHLSKASTHAAFPSIYKLPLFESPTQRV